MSNPTEEQAWIAVIRDPDFSTEVLPIIGEVSYISVDLGADFNGMPDDWAQAEEWADNVWGQAEDAPDEVQTWAESYINEMFGNWASSFRQGPVRIWARPLASSVEGSD